MTHDERWIARLKRTLAAMPESLEIVCYRGRIAVCEDGALEAFSDTGTSYGTAEDIETIYHPRVMTHSECQ